MDLVGQRKKLVYLRNNVGAGTGKLIASADDLRAVIDATVELFDLLIRKENDELGTGC